MESTQNIETESFRSVFQLLILMGYSMEIDEEIFNEFLATTEGKDYAGGQLPRCARYAFALFCHQKQMEFVGPIQPTIVDFTC